MPAIDSGLIMLLSPALPPPDAPVLSNGRGYKAAEPPLWLANGSASVKALTNCFWYFDFYLKRPDLPGLVISSQSFGNRFTAYCRTDAENTIDAR
jgi:hypothetical protein